MAKSPTDSQWLWISAFAGHHGKLTKSERDQEIQKHRTEHPGDTDLLDIAVHYLEQPPALDRDRSGETIDSYNLKQRLGHGGMGEVYLAEEFAFGKFQRSIALKLIVWPPALSSDEKKSRIHRFEQEVQKLAHIESENVVTLYKAGTYTDAATGEDFPYLVMRHVDQARSLTDYIKQAGLNTTEKLKLFLKVCEGVKQIHSKDLIHCDLKPANILVDSDGNPRVADFGLVKLLGDGTERGPFGIAEGSPVYMSPEQVSDHFGEISKKTDVYALGLILFEMLTGYLPYDIPKFDLDAEQWEQELRQVICQSTPEEVPKRLSAKVIGLNELIKKSLAKSTADRSLFESFTNEINRIVSLDRTKHLLYVAGWIAVVLFTLIGGYGLFGQIRTEESLASINTRLVEMIDSDLLAEIAEKSETEPGVIRQTLKQFKNQVVKKDLLGFADELVVKGRPEVAYALLSFMAETIFQSRESNYLLASKVFLKANYSLVKQIESTEDRLLRSKLQKQRLKILDRGINSFDTIPMNVQETENDTYRLLIFEYAGAVIGNSGFLPQLEQKDLFRDAILLFSNYNFLDRCPDNGKVDFYLRKAALMLHFAEYHNPDNEKKYIDESIRLSELAYDIASRNKYPNGLLNSIRNSVRSSLRKSITLSASKRRKMLEQIIVKCEQVPVVVSEDSKKTDLEIKILKAQAILELSQEPITESEKQDRVQSASGILKLIRGDVANLKDKWLSALFIEQWLLCNFYGLKEIDNYRVAFEEYAQAGYSSKVMNAKVLYSYLRSLNGFQSTFEEFDPVVNLISGDIKELNPATTPRISSQLLQELVSIYWWRSGISRFDVEDIKKYGSSQYDQRLCKETNDRLRLFFKEEDYPFMWAQAEEVDIRYDKQYGLSSEDTTRAIGRIINVNKLVTKDDDPMNWADRQLLLADLYSRHDAEIEKSIQVRESVLHVYTENEHPKKHTKVKQEISDLKSKVSGMK